VYNGSINNKYMNYKITIEEIIEKQDNKYPDTKKVYEQVFVSATGDKIVEIIKAVNSL